MMDVFKAKMNDKEIPELSDLFQRMVQDKVAREGLTGEQVADKLATLLAKFWSDWTGKHYCIVVNVTRDYDLREEVPKEGISSADLKNVTYTGNTQDIVGVL